MCLMSSGSLSASRAPIVLETADQEESARGKARAQIIRTLCSEVNTFPTNLQCSGRPDMGFSGKAAGEEAFEGVMRVGRSS